ncbi:hypothetical protein H0H93_005983 [Arthromyces matolae]|nr:hypothetical protein H0H93_005983 [Arthromyces matolae]
MSEDMPSSWRYIASASSRVSTFSRDYINLARTKYGSRVGPSSNGQEDGRKTWRTWAGQKLRLRRGPGDGGTKLSNETLNLFPGWAVRRYRKLENDGVEGAFEVEVFISGFAISHRSLENASRSQRAFIRLAKGFASLPKITADAIEPEPQIKLSPSTEALLQQKALPPRPDEITEDYVFEALERQLERAKNEPVESSNASTASTSSLDSPEGGNDAATITIPDRTGLSSLPAETLRRLHQNLEKRLQPFWSSVLSSRTVRIHLFGSPHHYSQSSHSEAEDENEAIERESSSYGPVGAQDVVTGPDGSFQVRFVIKWEDLCQHPGALHIAFGDKLEEHDLLVAAQIQPAISNPSSLSQPSDLNSIRANATTPSGSQDPPVSPIKTIRIPISHSPIRVISDIDDTVKLSNILSGARTVFQNVFVKDLKENIIPGMGEWYTSMWSQGARFHYVVGFLAYVNDLRSIRLRSYAGRSIFNGMLSAPATRKRAGVVDILESFPESRFILIGDTGEQDLELYTELARDRPNQILAVLVRDVETFEPIEDPTGSRALGSFFGDGPSRSRTRRTLSNLLSSKQGTPATSPTQRNGGDYFTSSPLSAEPEPIPISAKSSASSTTSAAPSPPPSAYPHPVRDNSALSKSSTISSTPSEAEKRRSALQARVYLARTQIPGHVPLRVFRSPEECFEVDEVLKRERVPS